MPHGSYSLGEAAGKLNMILRQTPHAAEATGILGLVRVLTRDRRNSCKCARLRRAAAA